MKAESESELARELHEHRGDPGEWGDEAEHIDVRPSRTAVVSCRLPMEEFRALEEAAEAAGESLSQYTRKALVMRERGHSVPLLGMSVRYSNPFFEVVTIETTRSDAPQPIGREHIETIHAESQKEH